MSQPHQNLITNYRTIDGLRIRYSEAGAASGRPILLTSPWPESIFAFSAIWTRLCELAPVIAVDLPGIGQSDARPDLFSPPRMGEFVAKIVSEFALDRPHAVGPDIGTSALLHATAANPELFSSLVIGSAAVDERHVTGDLKSMMEAPSMDHLKDVDGSAIVSQIISGMVKGPLPDLVLRDYLQSYAGSRFTDSATYIRSYPNTLPNLRKLLPSIRAPVMVIYGLDDPLVPPMQADILAGLLPRTRLVPLQCGHFTWEDSADEYLGSLKAWIDGGYSACYTNSPLQ